MEDIDEPKRPIHAMPRIPNATGCDWVMFFAVAADCLVDGRGIDSSLRSRASGHLKPPPYLGLPAGTCICGKVVNTKTKTRRWCGDDCRNVAYAARCAISYGPDYSYFKEFRGIGCQSCGEIAKQMEVDHIIPVAMGGGMAWFDNYQLLCKSCHRDKTRQDVAAIRNHQKLKRG